MACLIFSGSINIIFLAYFFYGFIQEHPPTPYFELKPAKIHEEQRSIAADKTDIEMIRYFRRMPMDWLVSRLNDVQLVENGYTQRDLVLASLIEFHHFDINRALANLPPPDQIRIISYGQFRDGTVAELRVFPGLSEKYFSAIYAFAKTERWPLTTKGLFLALQRQEKGQKEPSLGEAFFMTSDFNVVEMLFNRSGVFVERDELLAVLLEGDWPLLDSFVQQQKISQDLSVARRQSFLLEYIQRQSKSAAKLILKTEGSFAARKLDDVKVLQILQLMDEKSAEGENFAALILISPRSDSVWKLAAKRLYEYSEEPVPENLVRERVLARFVPGYGVNPLNGMKIESSISSAKEKDDSAPLLKTVQPEKTEANQNKKPMTSCAKESTPKSGVEKKVVLVKKNEPLSLPETKLKLSNTTPLKVTTQKLKLNISKPKTSLYIVQEGDTLWKISRRFNIDVEVIRAFNQLNTDLLTPGRTLKIPN